ncbi:dephospho-CoA kinase [Acetobacteraceae bacterium H6797]|nr:dephospho-CoA kinase [Acetobacteraceae bacterium H6797]
MIVLGLTGGIGMGKSTAAAMFRRLGVPVFDADAAVHRLQAKGGEAVAPIEAAFPGSTRDGRVDREALRRLVLGNPQALKRLEGIVHPLVRRAEARFLARHRRAGKRVVLLDIPLLFETMPRVPPPALRRPRRGKARRFDRIVTVSAPAEVQRRRVLSRPGMTEERLAAIRARQTPDAVKRRLADHVIGTGLNRHTTQAAIRRLMLDLTR